MRLISSPELKDNSKLDRHGRALIVPLIAVGQQLIRAGLRRSAYNLGMTVLDRRFGAAARPHRRDFDQLDALQRAYRESLGF